MPPDPLTKSPGGALLRGEACEQQASEADYSSHGSPKSTNALENPHQSNSRLSKPSIQIDLTAEVDNDPLARKRHHDDQPLPGPSNKRPKCANDGEASVNPELLQAKISCLMRDRDLKDNELKKRNRIIEDERQAHASTQRELETIKTSLHDTQEVFNQKLISQRFLIRLSKIKQRNGRQIHQELQAEIDTLKNQIASKVEDLRAKTKDLTTVSGERETFRRDLLAIRKRLDTTNQQANSLTQDLQRSQQLQTDVEKELSNTKTKAEAVSDELRKAKKDYEAVDLTNEKWADKFAQWKEAKKKLSKDLSEARKDAKAAHKDRDALKAEVAELGARVEELQADSERHLEECSASTSDLLQHIRDLKGLGQVKNFKISDEELLEHWGNLKHKIRQMVDRYARPLPGLNDQDLDTAWSKISSEPSALLRRPLFCEFAVEAYVWSWLNETIFEKGSTAWAGDLGSRFSELSRVTETESLRGREDELMAEFQSWRSASSHLFSRLHQRAYNHESYLEDIKGLIKNLQQLLGFDPSTYESARADATAILNDAREFDIMRRKLKAEINIYSRVVADDEQFANYDGDFVRAYMRNRSPFLSTQASSQNPNVDLVISPAIIRTGNSDGLDYDKDNCLVKMDVLCDVLVAFGEQPDFQMDFFPPAAQPLTSGQPAALHNQGQQDKVNVFNAKEDSAMERDIKTASRDVSHLKVTQTPQAASYVSAGDSRQHLNSNDASSSARPTRSSTRQSAQRALVALTRGIEDPDELAGSPTSDTDEYLGSNASRSRRRQVQDENDEPYVPDDED